MNGPRRGRWGLWAALAVGGVAFAVGLALGATTIFSASETAGGSAEAAQEISWLGESAVALASVPAPVPATANATAAAPTLLAAASAVFEIGTGRAGDSAVAWNLTLRSAPASTEVEVTVTAQNSSSGVEVAATVYLESPSTVTAGPYVLTLYLDLGPAGASLASTSLLLQQCNAPGACP